MTAFIPPCKTKHDEKVLFKPFDYAGARSQGSLELQRLQIEEWRSRGPETAITVKLGSTKELPILRETANIVNYMATVERICEAVGHQNLCTIQVSSIMKNMRLS